MQPSFLSSQSRETAASDVGVEAEATNLTAAGRENWDAHLEAVAKCLVPWESKEVTVRLVMEVQQQHYWLPLFQPDPGFAA